MPTAYAYLRYSTKAQGGADKDSIDRQMASIRALTAQYDIELLPENIYRDDGISSFDGSNKKTGKLKDLIDLILSQQIKSGDLVFVESIDRLSRQKFRLSKDLVYSILDKGVILITTMDGKKYYKSEDGNNDFEQDLYLTLIAQRAHEESKTKSIRRKSAWNRAKENAENDNKIFNAHNPPYGIEFDKVNNCFVINEEKAEEIRFIFKSLGSVGVTKTIQKVNEFSIKKWTNKTISILLESKYPLGFYKAQKRDENKRKVFDRFIENYYPAIITFEEYNNAVNSMKSRAHRKHYGKQSISSLNIFRHSVFCGFCGSSLFFETNRNQKGLRFSYLHCSRKKEFKIGCDAKRIRFEHAIGLLFKYIQNSFDTDETFKNVSKEEFENFFEGNEDAPKLKMDLKNEIEMSKKLIDLMNSKKSNIEEDLKIKSIQETILKNKHTLENFEKRIDEYNGEIPDIIFKKIKSTEDKIKELEIELNTIKQNSIIETKLNVNSLNEFIELLKIEDGRILINDFFVKNNLAFNYRYQPDFDKVFIEVKKDNQLLHFDFHKFDLHNPLKEYGFTKISDYE